MRTGARRLAGFEIVEQGALFFGRERLPRFDRETFADATRQFRFHLGLEGGLVLLEILHQRPQSGRGVRPREQRWDGAHLERVAAKLLHVEAEMLQGWQLGN